MLRFRYRPRARRMPVYPAAGQDGRLKKLREIVTGLIRYERLELSYSHADEARQYAERLISLALRYGDKHRETMELADYWLMEKDLVHKLFKVLVPRYQHYKTCYTDLHKLAIEYPGSGFANGVLELRGNPWPAVVHRQRDYRYTLSNILIAAAKQDFYKDRQDKAAQARDRASLSSPPAEDLTPSSVDPVSIPVNVSSNTVEPNPQPSLKNSAPKT